MTDKATIPFVATDSNDIVVHGYVEVHRPGPGGRDHGNPRAAAPYFEFLETRNVCLIDPAELRREMEAALAQALQVIGIEDPSQAAVASDVDAILRGVLAQCRASPDKYVSNSSNVTLANLNADDLQLS